MKTYHYDKRTIWLIFSGVAATFMTLHGRWHEIGIALVTPSFYAAFCTSFGITFLLIFLVNYCSTILNKAFPNKQYDIIRIILQFCFGVLLPSFLVFIAMYAYFKLSNRDLFETTYLLVDFPIVVIFLMLLNGYYVVSFAIQIKRKSLRVHNHNLAINYNGQNVQFDVEKDILYFYRDGKLIRLQTVSGKEYSMKDTVGNLSKKYESLNFCQINPSAIVNLKALSGYVAGNRRDTLHLVFRIEYQVAVTKNNLELLRVTKEHISKFKSSLETSLEDDSNFTPHEFDS